MSNHEELSERLFLVKSRLRIGTKEDLSELLGVSRAMLYLYESGKNDPPAKFYKELTRLEVEAGITHGNLSNVESGVSVKEDPTYESKCRFIPIISWAHAGDPTHYEELPESWQEKIATECRDKHALAVRIQGESMEPTFHEDDILIIMPSEEAHSGCLAVCKYRNDEGVVFRRVEFTGESRVRLVPINVRWPIDEKKREDFEWIYPVYERRTLVWKKRR